jgi:hypothetical protein
MLIWGVFLGFLVNLAHCFATFIAETMGDYCKCMEIQTCFDIYNHKFEVNAC